MEPFLGQIMQVGFGFAPVNWAQALGQTLGIQQNTALFSLLSTTFGGNGTTNFQLPAIGSRVVVGVGQSIGYSPYVWGQIGGGENVTLNINQMPSHTHAATYTAPTATLKAVTGLPTNATSPLSIPVAGSQLSNTNDNLAGGSPQIYSPASPTGPTVNLGGLALAGGSVTNALSGNSLPTPILPPYVALYTNIALQGIYPSRG
jgi:microcystin-dependent protein